MEDAAETPDQKPPQQDMFAGAPEPPPPALPRDKPRPGHARSLRALERLRDRVALVSRELSRLREENAALRREVEELQMHGLGAVEGTPVVFTENPDELRSRVESVQFGN